MSEFNVTGQPPGSRTMIGIVSSVPTIAIGTIGTPARIAVSTKPPRPNRARRYRSPYGLLVPLAPSGNTSSNWRSSRSNRRALSGWATTPPARASSVPSTGTADSPWWCSAYTGRSSSRSMPCITKAASMGTTPAWLATNSAPPWVGIRARCSKLNRNQYRYAGSRQRP